MIQQLINGIATWIKPMKIKPPNTRDIKYLFLHTTGTSMDATPDAMRKYWKNKLGWKNPGYHITIDKYGEAHHLLPFDKIANGVRGWNKNAIHISTIGGKDGTDTRTDQQKLALAWWVKKLSSEYTDIVIKGHRDVYGPDKSYWKKSCPNYDVTKWLKEDNVL